LKFGSVAQGINAIGACWRSRWSDSYRSPSSSLPPSGGRGVVVSFGKERIGKERIGKERIGKERIGKERIGKERIGKELAVGWLIASC
jgi:hypothetical protein